MRGMRVKLTYIFSDIGEFDQIFVTVSGLTEYEPPNHSCPILKIEGLCINSGDSYGWLVLMRKSSSKDDVPDKRW